MMKSVKDSVFEYIRQTIYTKESFQSGIETREIADALQMQRSNVSTILNQLVKEGKLEKSLTRPVLYKPKGQMRHSSEECCFHEMIGADNSLRNAVRLAKAAILYPNKSLNVLMISKGGCGTTYFVEQMYRFALESNTLPANAPFVKINCRHYAKNSEILDEELFGKENFEDSLFSKAKGGMLFIDYMDILNTKQRIKIFEFLETGILESEQGSFDCKDVYLVLSCDATSTVVSTHHIPVTIELPTLNERSTEEKLKLISFFFTKEAGNSKRSVTVEASVIRALYLNNFEYNIKDLRRAITSACANAYVRVINEPDKPIYICLDDLDKSIKRNILAFKNQLPQLNSYLGNSEIFNFTYDETLKEHIGEKFYSSILSQYNELTNHGINQTSIESVINNHINNLFNSFRYQNMADNSKNLEQLSKIVDKRIIEIVSDFLENFQNTTGRNFRANIFYGLCLHINSLLANTPTHQRITNDQIIDTIQKFPEEYAWASAFAGILKNTLSIAIDVSETVIITMFFVEQKEDSKEAKPVLLYAMHGNGTAHSLCEATNALTHSDNVYSFDMALDSDCEQAMSELKELLLKIDQGAGVIVIYDMGSIKTMLETIADETNIQIRYINIPITLLGIEIARKCSMENDVDTVFHASSLEYNQYIKCDEHRNRIIITLCHTGEGASSQLKNYIDQYSRLGMQTIALSMSNRNELLNEVMILKRSYHIHAFIGTDDPKMLGIPFISIVNVFQAPKEVLDRLLMFEPLQTKGIDYRSVYEYLEENLKYASISKLKTTLPGIIDELSVIYNISREQVLGIFLHLACLVERLLSGDSISKNPETEKIISIMVEDYHIVLNSLKRLEKAFKIIIDDNEIACLIMMLKKI